MSKGSAIDANPKSERKDNCQGRKYFGPTLMSGLYSILHQRDCYKQWLEVTSIWCVTAYVWIRIYLKSIRPSTGWEACVDPRCKIHKLFLSTPATKKLHSIAVSTSNSKFLRTGRNPWFCTSSSNIDRPLPVARQLSWTWAITVNGKDWKGMSMFYLHLFDSFDCEKKIRRTATRKCGERGPPSGHQDSPWNCFWQLFWLHARHLTLLILLIDVSAWLPPKASEIFPSHGARAKMIMENQWRVLLT